MALARQQDGVDRGVDKNKTLKEIFNKVELLGDLPVFTASVNHICNISSDPDADAMQLSNEVLKDANLSLKMLKLANSPYYNRTGSKINVVSRAVILLGFETIKNLTLTLKLIESFQHEYPGIDMDKLLVESYIAAGFVRDLAIKCGITDVEETYTCSLLHNLGQIAIAYFLPEKYVEISQLNDEGAQPPIENEKQVLGAAMTGIGKELAASWDFPARVVSTMDNDIPKIKGGITKTQELNHVLSVLCADVVGSLYHEHGASDKSYNEKLIDLSHATGIALKDIEGSLKNSFLMSCKLATDFGLNRDKLRPVVSDTDDEGRDKVARMFSYYVTNLSLPGDASKAAIEEAPEQLTEDMEASLTAPVTGKGVNAELQLQYIQEITSLLTSSAKLNTVLVKVLEALNKAVGFKHVVLGLLSIDRKSYVGRISIGPDSDAVKAFFNRQVDIKTDIFSKAVIEGTDVLVQDTSDERWNEVIPNEYLRIVGSASFVVAALRSGPKPLGFIYADTGSELGISPEQHRGFIQFAGQARLALQTCR